MALYYSIPLSKAFEFSMARGNGERFSRQNAIYAEKVPLSQKAKLNIDLGFLMPLPVFGFEYF